MYIFATNDHELVANIEVENTNQSTSDHKLILVKTRINLSSTSKVQEDTPGSLLASLNFWSKDIDWQLLKGEFAGSDWQELLRDEDIDIKASKLLDYLEETCSQHVPIKIIKKKNIIPRDRRILMRKRKNLCSKILKIQNPRVIESLEAALESIANDLIMSHKQQRLKEEEELGTHFYQHTVVYIQLRC